MTKISLLFLLIINLFAYEIPTDYVKKHKFAKSINVNAKIIQLSNAKQSIMSLLGGHIEKYFINAGDSVKKDQAIALIDSIELLNLTSQYLSLKKQFSSFKRKFNATKSLYQKGLTSMQELNIQKAKQDELISKIHTLKSQLITLDIDVKNLKQPISEYILYSHGSGIVSEILQPLHSIINKETQIINIVKEQAFYLKSFIPLKYAPVIKYAKKATLHYMNKDIPVKIDQILPSVDEKTQRIILLSRIQNDINDLFIGAFVGATVYLAQDIEYLAVKKSALSFYNNEWVVFVPKNNHQEHHHQDRQNDVKDHSLNEQISHDDHEDKEIPYEPKIVKIIKTYDGLVAIEGLKEGETYVSDKAYYVKSLLLKSSLSGHGH